MKCEKKAILADILNTSYRLTQQIRKDYRAGYEMSDPVLMETHRLQGLLEQAAGLESEDSDAKHS